MSGEAAHVHNYNYEAVRNAEGYLKVDVPNKVTASIADHTPENILDPHSLQDIHQRNYVIASAVSEGHKIQAANIHAAGFLNADDPVAISFWIISIAMIAATVFFLMEALTLKTHWKTSLHVGALVTLVAAVHYLYMREYWVKFQQSPIVYRYIDWSITVPLQMVEFYLILSAVNPNISGGMFWRLMIGTVAMLAFGYLGESGNMNAWLGFALGMAGWAFILFEVFFGEAGQAAVRADKMNPFIKSAFNTMRLIVTVGWSIYPLGYFFGYLLHQWGDSPCNFTYNIADFVNKIAFCLAIWHAGRKDTLQGSH
jgi:bacteriorhodopsin